MQTASAALAQTTSRPLTQTTSRLLEDKHRLGMICFIASESVFFIILIVTYVFYRSSPANAHGPTPFKSLDIGRTAVFTACLLSSSFTMWRAGYHHERGHGFRWGSWLLLTIGLGAAFLYGEITEYYTMSVIDKTVPNSDVFAGSFYALTGVHAFHVFLGLLLLSTLFLLTLRGKFRKGSRAGAVHAITIYWHFVDGVWAVIFPTVYLWSLGGPR
jgi:heme/copper-type cytochrome/quinol oxidase subunit 3